MQRQLKSIAVSLGVVLTIFTTALSAFADAPVLVRGRGLNASATSASRLGCSKMQASEVAWVTLTDAGDIDQQVSGYPSGVTTITPVFQYNCVPQGTTIVSVFTFNGETVFTDKESLKQSSKKGLYSYPISYKDDQPIDEGEWGVQFFSGKTLLAEGAVVVGEAPGPGGGSTTTQAVTVQGTVVDKKTRKPIKGATVLVLKPGVTLTAFINGGQKEKDVFTAGQSDSQGQFSLSVALTRGETYALIIVAKGYKATGHQGLTIANDAPDPLTLTVTMTK